MCYSAAGCWSRPKVLPAFVRVGSTSLRKKNTVFSGFQTDVVSATTHPFYTRFIKNDFDVALVRFKHKKLEMISKIYINKHLGIGQNTI